MSNLAFKHSGTLGDLIYGLSVVKYLGGGDFYLHMNQIDYLSRHYYGVPAPAFHAGRMNDQDFDFMRSFMLAQTYITKFEKMDPRTSEITHNLDNFRTAFIQHPGNYVDIYAQSNRITDPETITNLRNTAWLSVPSPKIVDGRDVVINRTARWIPPQLSPVWQQWHKDGMEDRAMFIGLPSEHEEFKRATGWNIPHQPTTSLLEVAEYIAGSKVFVGNQSVALSLAIGLGHQEILCEVRRDLPSEKNECFFKDRPGITYF